MNSILAAQKYAVKGSIQNENKVHLFPLLQGTGGDIDCFAGDAILIVYEAERLWERTDEAVRNRIQAPDGTAPTKLSLATMAASQCGGRLLNKLSPYHFSDGSTESTLTLHGSIGAGGLRTVNLGGTTVQVSRRTSSA